MAPFFVRTEKRTVATLGGHGANVYEFFGSVLGLQLESMTIFYFFLLSSCSAIVLSTTCCN